MGITAFGGPESLVQLDLPTPDAPRNGVLIRVKAAGIGIWDAYRRSGNFKLPDGVEFPIALGVEVSGVIEKMGGKVEGMHPGDDVFAFVPFGGWAEFAATTEALVAHKPANVNYARAAALPVAAVTADMAINEALAVQKGETVFIAGGSGGVGIMAIQLAKRAGARVIASTSTKNLEFLAKLGAEAVDYTAGDVASAVHGLAGGGVDAALDAVGGENAETTARTVRSGGRIAELTGYDLQVDDSIAVHHVVMQMSGGRLNRIAELVDDGSLKVEVARTFPLEQAKDALGLVEGRHVRGKVVLTA